MYYIYRTNLENEIVHYSYEDDATVFGSINGIITKILREITPKNQNEEYRWHIDFKSDLGKIGLKEKAVIIDLKPNTEGNISLYEIWNIFGYSSHGWTPMMFHLKPLFVDEEGNEEDKNEFDIDISSLENVFTFHHVYDGSVKDGEIIGKWIPPRPSSTNSALLWDDSIDYFFECRNLVRNQ